MKLTRIRPDQLNLLLTIGGFLFNIVFYILVLSKHREAPAVVAPSVSEYRLQEIESRYKQQVQHYKAVQDSLTNELQARDSLLQVQQKKLGEVKQRIRVNISQSWDELPEKEKQAYTEYAITQIQNLSP